jgi:hypothetical protein
MKFKVQLWAYVDGDEGAEGPPFKDLGAPLPSPPSPKKKKKKKKTSN